MYHAGCWKTVAMALVVAGWGLVAGAMADGLSLCQTGQVLVVPQGAPGIRVGPFVTPKNSHPITETHATVKWDDTALTVIFDCADTNIQATHTQRDDVGMWQDDCVEVFLDIGHTHDEGWLHILVSASGGVCDAQGSRPVYDETGGDLRYQLPGLTSRVERTSGGWRATLLLPWQGLGKKPRLGDIWGFNLNRENHPEEEYSCWSPTPHGFTDFNEWGHLVFAPPAYDGVPPAGGATLEAIARRHAEIPHIIRDRANREKLQITREITKWERMPLDNKGAAQVSAKQRGHTMWREDWVRQARRNVADTVWGKAIANRILEVADYWAAKSDLELLNLVPTGNPRALTPGQYYGDPISGGNRATLCTCLETPGRWYNPTTKQWWYDGVAITNPGTGEKLVVKDDGSGFVAPEGFPRPGVRTYFTAAYRGYLIGMLVYAPYAGQAVTLTTNDFPGTTGLRYSGAIPRLAEAYALTGNPTYARKAAILMGRLAELYPYMNGGMDDDPRFVSVDRSVWLEKSTTDSEFLRSFLDAVDLVWDAVDADLDRQLAELFSGVPGPEGTPRTESFKVKTALNEMMPYAAQLCERSRQDIGTDWAFRWINTEMALAACTESPKLMAHVLLGPCPALQGMLREEFYRDGRHSYDSAAYLALLAQSFRTLPFRSVGFQGGRDFPTPLNLYADSRFLLDDIIGYNYKTDVGAINPTLTPTFGDGDSGRNPRPPSDSALSGYQPYNASMEVPAAFSDKFRALFQESFRGREAELDQMREQGGNFMTLAFARPWVESAGYTGTTALASSLLEDSATAYLRSGRTPRTRHDLVLWGAPSGAHTHGDKLGLWFGGRGRNLAAAGGGYPFAQNSTQMSDWERHSAACWVVLVDGADQKTSYSDLTAFYAGDLFRLSSLVNTQAYSGSRQQRDLWLIPGPQDGDAYAVDIFQVAGGGKCFDYNTRGNDAGRFEDLRFDFQGGTPAWESHAGSLAGTKVALFSRPGYGWIKDVRMTPVTRDFSWQYDYGGAGLKVHALSFGYPRTLIYALGPVGGFARGQSPWDPHILWRDEAPEGTNHVTQFVTVLESVGVAPFLKTVQTLTGTEPTTGIHPVGLKITHVSGHMDVILINPQPGRKIAFTDAAGARWETDAHTAMQRLDPAGRIMQTEIYDGRFLKTPQGDYVCPAALEGVVETVDYPHREVGVRLEATVTSNSSPQALENLVGILYPATGGRLTAYRIEKAMLTGTRLSFVSPLSLIRSDTGQGGNQALGGFSNRPMRKIEKQKVQVDIVPGDRFRLPLAARFEQ